MRALRWLLLLAMVLVAGGGALAWWGPGWLDWGRYRGEITSFASARLGRAVAIDGEVSFRLLPEPVLMASGVSVAAASDGVAVSARQLRLRVGLWGLLAGRLEAQELVLRGARVRLPWPFRPVAVVPAEWFSAAEVRIEDGTVEVGDLSFTAIAGTLTTDIWTGSYAASGTMRFAGRPWHVSARLSRAGGDGSAGLEVALDGQGPVLGLGAAFSGQLRADGGFLGRISGRGPDLSQLMPAPPLPFAADGRISEQGGLVAADEISGELGGAPLRGAVALRLQPALRLDLAFSSSRLDLDAWRAALARAPAAAVPTGIDLSVEAATLFGGVMRQVHLSADLAGSEVDLREARAVLPGEAAINGAGRLMLDGGGNRFEGDVRWAAPSLRTTLAWLGAAGAGLPEGVLRSAQGSAHVALEPGRWAASRLDSVVDGTRLTGGLSLHAGEHPAVTAALRAERLDLDGWWPAGSAAWAPVAGWLAVADADLRLSAADVALRGVPLGAVTLDAATEAGQIHLRRLEFAPPGLRAVASGTLGPGARVSEGRLDVQAATPAALLGPWADRLPPALVAALRGWNGPATVALQLAGPPEALTAKLAAEAGDLRLEAEPALDFAHWRFTGPVTLRHPGARRLAENLGQTGLGAYLGDGSFALVAQMAAGLSPEGVLTVGLPGFDLAAGGLRAQGALLMDFSGEVPMLSGRVAAETLPLPRVAWHDTAPLPFAALRGWNARLRVEAASGMLGMRPLLDHLAANLTLEDGRLGLEGLRAGLAGGTLSGRAVLDLTGERPVLSAEGQFEGVTVSQPLFGLPVDLTAGTLAGTVGLTAEGYSPAALLATSAGQVRLQAEGASLEGFTLGDVAAVPQDAAARAALTGGSTAPMRLALSLAVARGVVEVSEGTLEGPAGQGSASGLVDLAGETINLRLGLRPAMADPPELSLRLTGRLGAPDRDVELAALALWRAVHLPPPSAVPAAAPSLSLPLPPPPPVVHRPGAAGLGERPRP